MKEPIDQAITLLVKQAIWVKAPPNENGIIFFSTAAEKDIALKMNDFPEENLLTLLLGGQAVLEFNDWPDQFGNKPWQHQEFIE